MAQRLINPEFNFVVVYALYHHEFFGYLLSSDVVQVLPSGTLSRGYQGLNPANFEQFAHRADDIDRRLVQHLAEIQPIALIKRFGGDIKKQAEFFEKKFQQDAVKKLAHSFVQRKVAEAFALIRSWKRELYETGKDGYPAEKRIAILDELAEVQFHFSRTDRITHYFPVVMLRGKRLDFVNAAELPCIDPAWMLCRNELFSFRQEIEGLKLKPFLNKNFIAVPQATEADYYQRFVTQLVEKYDVHSKGFDIIEVRQSPQFMLRVKDNAGKSFSLLREAHYAQFVLPLSNDNSPTRVILDKHQDEYRFIKIHRDIEAENHMLGLLDAICPNPSSFTAWDYVTRDEGLQWLSKHAANLPEMGCNILQEGAGKGHINFSMPILSLRTQEVGDWFDLNGVVRIGEFDLPFSRFRQHILRGKREFTLPDGSIAILPEGWFADYRHVMEVAQTNSEDDTLRIARYQAPLIDMIDGERMMLRELNDTGEITPITAPESLQATLRDYQAHGLSWLAHIGERGMGGILADDMGLGKTLQTIALLTHTYEQQPVLPPSLVVLPTSLVHNWRNELRKFSPALRVMLHTGANRTESLQLFTPYNIILTTYGTARQDIELLRGFPFHYVILDESQNIKNPHSQTAQAMRKLLGKHRLALTGTPVENTVLDVWSQMSFLNPGLLGSEHFFKEFYVKPIEQENNVRVSEKLRKIIYPYILRRRKEQVETELPPKIENIHYCVMEDEQAKLYEETRSAYRNYLLQIFETGAFQKSKLDVLAGLQKLRQIAIHPKLIEPGRELLSSGKYRQVRELLETILAEGKKVLIFSQYVKMLEILRKDLDQQNIAYCYLDGSTRDRQGQVDEFQNNPAIPVFLISLKAGGVGLTLTAAEYVFILDPWWNPAAEMQAIDRAHRIGQQKTVMYYKFISEDSIEEKILAMQHRKAKLSTDLIAVEEEFFSTLSVEDIADLVS